MCYLHWISCEFRVDHSKLFILFLTQIEPIELQEETKVHVDRKVRVKLYGIHNLGDTWCTF